MRVVCVFLSDMFSCSIIKVFSNYQMQQMTADFMDTFGLDGDEFQEPNDALA